MYANIEQLQEHLGALRLAAMSTVDDGQQPALFERLLRAATARMDSVFRRARYATPLALSSIEHEETRTNLEAMLALHCCTLAAWSMVAGLTAGPEGLREASNASEKWLEGLLDGTEELLGLEKTAKAAHAGGRLGAVLGRDDLDRLERQMDRFSRLGRS